MLDGRGASCRLYVCNGMLLLDLVMYFLPSIQHARLLSHVVRTMARTSLPHHR